MVCKNAETIIMNNLFFRIIKHVCFLAIHFDDCEQLVYAVGLLILISNIYNLEKKP